MNPTETKREPLAAVAAAEARRWAADPNVACVGIGLKFVEGKPTLQAALQYHVRAKLPDEAAIRNAGSAPVPGEVGGYLTDVIERGIDRPAACPGSKSPTGDRGSDRENPLVGGTSTTVLGDFHSFPTGYGTLGGVCVDAASGAPMALSNAHVYGDDLGNDAIQPWLPTGEYLEATVKYLFCGGPLAHLFFWTAPSPLTGILTGAAAAAWIAAAASDAEDPSRWGQRTGTVPPAGAFTEREQIHLEAEPPRLPFPGRDWSTATHWRYQRTSTAGTTATSISESRANEHVLVGKRVITDRLVYRGGDRVRICAELWTPIRTGPEERFVVAHTFPMADPGRITRRVLVRSTECRRIDRVLAEHRKPRCLHGFEAQVPGVATMVLPVVDAPFRLWSEALQTKLDGTALVIPPEGFNIACPPSTRVELRVAAGSAAVTATAFSANGRAVAHQAAAAGSAGPQTIRLEGPELVRVFVESGSGDSSLGGICVDKDPLDPQRWKAHSHWYTATFDLPMREPAGTWAVVVVAQTMDDSPTGGDPIAAARRLGGIVDSANAAEMGECACTILFDHTFEVS